MLKLIVVGDLHLHPYNEFSRTVGADGLTDLGHHIISTAEWLVGVAGRQDYHRGGPLVINGDYTTTPGYLDGPTMRLIAEFEKVLRPVHRVYNLGNHDQSSAGVSLHNLEIHGSLASQQLTVVRPNQTCYIGSLGISDEDAEPKYVYAVPYTFTIEEQRQLLSGIKDNSVVLIHYPIKGVRMTPDVCETEGLELAELRRFRLVFASHYHLPQIHSPNNTVVVPKGSWSGMPEWGTVVVTGTPMAHSFGDTNDGDYGAWVLKVNLDNHDWLSGQEFILSFERNPYTPAYRKLKVASIKQAEAALNQIGVRDLYVSLETDDPKIAAALRKQGNYLGRSLAGKRVKLIRQSQSSEKRLDVSPNENVSVALERYLEANPPTTPTPTIQAFLKPFLDELEASQALGSEIAFSKLTMSNFLSWETAEVDLGSPDLVLVSGVNLDSETADSNGSGKSSLLEAICWCLFNTTYRGISGDEVIHKGADGCCVSVAAVVNGAKAVVSRYRKHPTLGTGVSLWIDGVNVSKSLSADTNKEIIRVLGMSLNTFCILSYLGQGFESKFTSLPDSEKKLLLESVFGLEYYDQIKTKLAMAAKKAESVMIEDYGKVEAIRHLIETRQQELATKKAEAQEFEAQREDQLKSLRYEHNIVETVVSSLRHELGLVYTALNELDSLNEGMIGVRESLNSRLESAQAEAGRSYNAWVKLDRARTALESGDLKCETCGQALRDQGAVEKRRKELLGEIDAVCGATDRANHEVARYQRKLSVMKDRWASFTAEKSSLKDRVISLENLVSQKELEREKLGLELARVESTDVLAPIKMLEESLEADKKKLADFEAVSLKSTKSYTLAKECLDLFGTKGLRSFVLDEGISTLNGYLADEVARIFGSDYSLKISSTTVRKSGKEDNSISIEFGTPGGSYGASSGGERRKADIAIHLALAKLATTMGRGSTNLLIADEVLDTLDFTASKAVIDALTEIATEKRVFLISHSTAIKSVVPNILSIQKKDGISRIV